MMDRHNKNTNETDSDKQFQEDLEKATALSLETLALEEFHRNKLHLHSSNDVSSASSIIKFSTCKWFIFGTPIYTALKIFKQTTK